MHRAPIEWQDWAFLILLSASAPNDRLRSYEGAHQWKAATTRVAEKPAMGTVGGVGCCPDP
jgi:hypothetical protein